MRKWGIIVTAFYALVVCGLLVPAGNLLGLGIQPWSAFWRSLRSLYVDWLLWIPIAVVLSGQALLLFLSVDTSWKRLKPRAHILVSSSLTGMLVALLSFAAFLSLDAGIYGDNEGPWAPYISSLSAMLMVWGVLWLLWGYVFFLYVRNSSEPVTRVVSWLLKGSVLELLIAVPCHIVVRRRHDCSAPAVTSFGIITGIAIMLLSFGPSILLLYKKRLDSYSKLKPAAD